MATKNPGVAGVFVLMSDHAARLAYDQHRHFQRLLVVEAWIDHRAVGAVEIALDEGAGATETFGNTLARELEMHATEACAGRGVDVEGLVEFARDVGEAAGLVAVAG